MYGLMSVKACADDVVWVEKTCSSLDNIVNCDGLDVMEYDDSADFSVANTKIASHIANHDVSAELLPLDCRVKRLVEVSIPAKGFLSDLTIES